MLRFSRAIGRSQPLKVAPASFAAALSRSSYMPQSRDISDKFISVQSRLLSTRAPHSSESFLSGNNANVIEDMMESWRQDPTSVDASWHSFFQNVENNLEPGAAVTAPKRMSKFAPSGAAVMDSASNFNIAESLKIFLLIRSYRVLGHFLANLDPLKLNMESFSKIRSEYMKELNIETYGFSEADMERSFFVGDDLPGPNVQTLREITSMLKRSYCGNIGVQYMHCHDPAIKEWVKTTFELSEDSYKLSVEDKKMILSEVTTAEVFEDFLGKRFKSKRFGLNGGESLIPGLQVLTEDAAAMGIENIVIGMPHRGRLNVMAHIMGKPYPKLFNEFNVDAVSPEDKPSLVMGSGDVKYHLGTSCTRTLRNGKQVHLSMTANPSHLEAVNTVVEGKTRAKQTLPDGTLNHNKALSILIHGDAAFAGQGIVGETLEMSGLKYFTTGGTIHVIVNNQIGFTTVPKYARTSPYPSEIAKAAGVPIFHVNGDDPEAVVRCFKLAIEFRQKFHMDSVIDLWCYRRYGHNELDEPRFTQPKMYKNIEKHPTVSKIYTDTLLASRVVDEDEVKAMVKEAQQKMQDGFEKSKDYKSKDYDWLESHWRGFKSQMERAQFKPTGVKEEDLRRVMNAIVSIPDSFKLHSTLKNRRFKEFQTMIDTGRNFDWAFGEALAFGTLLNEGYGVRLSGQDCERGTFSHRHAVLYDQETEDTYVPLDNVRPGQGHFQVINSNLSEMGVLGFEHGYSIENPNCLVIWEAQFGDFANGAQVIIDQFIASGEQKWLRMSGLVMLLPHGMEGQGPEHSSARLERYLQLVDDDPRVFTPTAEVMGLVQNINMLVANPTTPANLFHLLRRQIHREFRKPLVVMSPKFLLKYRDCVSDINDFLEPARFKRLIPDSSEYICPPEQVRKVLISQGKVYYDLLNERMRIRQEQDKQDDIVLLRVEQVAPFPMDLVAQEVEKYPNAEVVWVQEEPLNQGAWAYAAPRIETALKHIGRSDRPTYVGRAPSAAPATGRLSTHKAELRKFLNEAFDVDFSEEA